MCFAAFLKLGDFLTGHLCQHIWNIEESLLVLTQYGDHQDAPTVNTLG